MFNADIMKSSKLCFEFYSFEKIYLLKLFFKHNEVHPNRFKRFALTHLFCGRLSNPNVEVFFIAISRIKQVRRFIFSVYIYSNLTRRNNERKNSKYCKVIFQILILRSSSQISQELNKLGG